MCACVRVCVRVCACVCPAARRGVTGHEGIRSPQRFTLKSFVLHSKPSYNYRNPMSQVVDSSVSRLAINISPIVFSCGMSYGRPLSSLYLSGRAVSRGNAYPVVNTPSVDEETQIVG